MAMQAESLEVLDKAQFPAGQARAIVRAIEIEINGARDTLATKQDVLMLRQEMGSMRHDLEGKIDALRGEVQGVSGEVQGIRGEVQGIRGEMQGLRGEMQGLRGEMQGVCGDLRAEIHTVAGRSTRQLLAATLTLMSMLVGIFYFLLARGAR